MKSLKINAYEAYTNSDLTEGRGRDVHIGYFEQEADAKRASQGKGVMGSDAWVRKVSKEIFVFENYQEFEQRENEETRQRALNKLTVAERRSLGLD